MDIPISRTGTESSRMPAWLGGRLTQTWAFFAWSWAFLENEARARNLSTTSNLYSSQRLTICNDHSTYINLQRGSSRTGRGAKLSFFLSSLISYSQLCAKSALYKSVHISRLSEYVDKPHASTSRSEKSKAVRLSSTWKIQSLYSFSRLKYIFRLYKYMLSWISVLEKLRAFSH